VLVENRNGLIAATMATTADGHPNAMPLCSRSGNGRSAVHHLLRLVLLAPYHTLSLSNVSLSSGTFHAGQTTATFLYLATQGKTRKYSLASVDCALEHVLLFAVDLCVALNGVARVFQLWSFFI
jgi:hypothetical protein